MSFERQKHLPYVSVAASCILHLFSFVSLPTQGRAQTPSDIIERLHRAEAETSLDDPTLKPWHLRLSFDIFGPKDVVVNTGTIEEWWAPGFHRIEVKSKTHTSVEVLNEKGLFHSSDTASVPYEIDQLRSLIVHPMPAKLAVQGSIPEMRKQATGKVALDCIMLSQKVGVGLTEGREFNAITPLGLFPTYCLDQGKDSLRLVSDSGIQTLTLNRIGRFMGRTVGVRISTQAGPQITSQANVETLMGATVGEGRYEQVDDLVKVEQDPVQVGAAVIAGKVLSKPGPIYPASAKAAHVAGKVILRAIIGRDGHLRNLSFIQVPSPDLAVAAMQAVRNWTYTPYLIDGKPVEVDTLITVTFTFEAR